MQRSPRAGLQDVRPSSDVSESVDLSLFWATAAKGSVSVGLDPKSRDLEWVCTASLMVGSRKWLRDRRKAAEWLFGIGSRLSKSGDATTESVAHKIATQMR